MDLMIHRRGVPLAMIGLTAAVALLLLAVGPGGAPAATGARGAQKGQEVQRRSYVPHSDCIVDFDACVSRKTSRLKGGPGGVGLTE